jgi:ATP-dependent RNA helicase RhlE
MDTTSTTFAATGLAAPICEALASHGLVTPTPIQAAAIPLGLQGHDVIGIAQTGTGKTYAFGLPMIEQLQKDPMTAGLILVPTRELALQVEESLRKVLNLLQLRMNTVVLIGGAAMDHQVRQLKRFAPQIVIATPGRLQDHINQGIVRLDPIKYLVLDEADRMLDMGFAPQVERIMETMPEERQTMLFSATMSPEVTHMAKRYQKNPQRVEVARAGISNALITQELYVVHRDDKFPTLRMLLQQYEGSVLVFVRTKHSASNLMAKLEAAGETADEIHSNRSLGQRKAALAGFKTGRTRVLVATDIAARGIDVDGIALVVNYDLPMVAEDYVHRIGRTGRAGKEGMAISLATPDQERDIRAIERLMQKRLPRNRFDRFR